MRNAKQKTPLWHKAQERFQKFWLDKQRGNKQCMWQEARPVELTRVACMECWLVGEDMYMVQFFDDGITYVVFRQERPHVAAANEMLKALRKAKPYVQRAISKDGPEPSIADVRHDFVYLSNVIDSAEGR